MLWRPSNKDFSLKTTPLPSLDPVRVVSGQQGKAPTLGLSLNTSVDGPPGLYWQMSDTAGAETLSHLTSYPAVSSCPSPYRRFFNTALLLLLETQTSEMHVVGELRVRWLQPGTPKTKLLCEPPHRLLAPPRKKMV